MPNLVSCATPYWRLSLCFPVAVGKAWRGNFACIALHGRVPWRREIYDKMKTLAPKQQGVRKARVAIPAAPDNLGPFASKLDAAFREIFSGTVTVREVEIPDPAAYGPTEVRATRKRLSVSVAVFAQLLGVSAKLVEHWEQGRRAPAPLAARLLDRINADPDAFLSALLRRRHVDT